MRGKQLGVVLHKLMILLRDKLGDFWRNFFGEEMGGGGQGDPDPLDRCQSMGKHTRCYRKKLMCFKHVSKKIFAFSKLNSLELNEIRYEKLTNNNMPKTTNWILSVKIDARNPPYKV